ncbi:MAG TPA: sulfite exporter TauE/SafE family protein [Acidimicrobiales bacterium]|nr:sulfite exporter TauE/SafE family protein [Acidimicrobiales bacterium]
MPTASPHLGSAVRSDQRWGRIVAVGVIAGFTSGLFGVGGGIVIVPALVMVARFPHKLATGTSLGAIVPISVAGVVGYATAGEVDWAAAACVSVGAVAGAVAGTRWLLRISTPVLQLGFATAMVLTAAKMFVDDGSGAGRSDLTLGMALALVALGVASGILAGLLGVGGGIIIVPVLTLGFGLPHVLAKGTSLAVILPTAVIGTARNRQSRLTALRPAAVVGLAGIGSAYLASRLSIGLDPELSQTLFAGLVAVAAVRLARTGLAGLRAGPTAPAAGGAARDDLPESGEA